MALSLSKSLKRQWQDDEGNYNYKRKLSRHSYKNEIQKSSFTDSSDNKPDGCNGLVFLTEGTNSSEFCNDSPHKNTHLLQSGDKHDIHFMDQDLHENTSNIILSMSSLQKVDAPNEKRSLPQCPECASGKSVGTKMETSYLNPVFKKPHAIKIVQSKKSIEWLQWV